MYIPRSNFCFQHLRLRWQLAIGPLPLGRRPQRFEPESDPEDGRKVWRHRHQGCEVHRLQGVLQDLLQRQEVKRPWIVRGFLSMSQSFGQTSRWKTSHRRSRASFALKG